MKNLHRRPDGIYEARMRVRPIDRIIYRSTGTRDKSVAQKMLDDWFRQMEREAHGLTSVTGKEKAAAEKPLLKHLQTYLHEQSVLGLNDRYMLQIENQLKRLIEECDWQYIQNVDKASFNAWRANNGTLSPKTLNQYLGAITGLLKWLVENEHLKKNPLEGVRRVSSKKWEEDSPRALTEKEVEALLSIAGPRRAVYATAVLTGIRRGELKQLRVGDIVLDVSAPYILVRSSVAKNGKEECVEVPAVLLDILRGVKAGRSAGEKAFEFPTWKTFQRDLTLAGIARRDEEGRKASFHSLRHTICTEGLKAGIAPRVMQKMMRHSDIRLTTETYTDTARLPVAAEVNRLPTYGLVGAEKVI
jgi:integrase